MNQNFDESVSEKIAAKILGIAPFTLRKQRSLGAEPGGIPMVPYIRHSPKCIRYSMRDLEAYKAAHRVDPATDGKAL